MSDLQPILVPTAAFIYLTAVTLVRRKSRAAAMFLFGLFVLAIAVWFATWL